MTHAEHGTGSPVGPFQLGYRAPVSSGVIAGIVVAGIVAVLLLANYIGVTIQERREGTTPVRRSPAELVEWSVLGDADLGRTIRNGPKIEAIKRYRELTGVGLKEAKDVVQFLSEHPEMLGPPRSP